MSEDPKSLPEFPITFHIGIFERIVFGILILYLVGGGIFLFLYGLKVLGLPSTVFGVYFGFYTAKISIQFTDEGILYFNSFNLFSAPQKISWMSIQKAETGVETSGRSARYFTRLYGRENGELIMDITIKPFSKECVRLLGFVLQEKAIGAKLDEATKDLAQGYVPSLVLGKAKPWL